MKNIINARIFPERVTIGNFSMSRKEMNIAACSVALAACAFWSVKVFMDEEMQLSMLNGDATESCYSFSEDSKYKNETALGEARDVLRIMQNFRVAGYETANDMQSRGAGFCFGIEDEDVQPTAIWTRIDFHFAEASYPLELAALTFYEPIMQKYWDGHIQDPESLNEYNFEDALLFSRLTRAANIATQLGDLMEAQKFGYNTKNSAVWSRYVTDNPELESTVNALLDSYSGTVSYKEALTIAIDTYLQDEAALAVGDEAFLTAYLDHVSILNKSSHTYIYNGPQWGNYAKVDADRDGQRDDVIYMGYGNRADEVYYDYQNAWRLSHQTESYECGTSEKPATCWRNVEEFVYYESIPAAETGTLSLHPATIASIGALTTHDLWSVSDAENILDDARYFQPLSAENQSLFAQIRGQIEANIPGRNTGASVENFGLHLTAE